MALEGAFIAFWLSLLCRDEDDELFEIVTFLPFLPPDPLHVPAVAPRLAELAAEAAEAEEAEEDEEALPLAEEVVEELDDKVEEEWDNDEAVVRPERGDVDVDVDEVWVPARGAVVS